MHQPFRLGEWTVLPPSAEILRGDERLRLEPRVMEVLDYLASRAGEMVSREELLQAVWTDTYVTEDVVWRSISLLRRALGDDSHQPKILETLPRLGYRLIAEVSPVGPPPEATVAPAESKTEAPPATPLPERQGAVETGPARRRPALVAAGLLTLLAGGMAWLWLAVRPPAGEASSTPAGAVGGGAPATAEDCYALAVQYYWRPERADKERALALFQRAVDLDPGHARAWAGLAEAYFTRYYYADEDPRWLQESLAAAKRALALEPDLAEGHKALALVYVAKGWRTQAILHNRRALELQPDNVAVKQNLAVLYMESGDLDQALLQQRAAAQASPPKAGHLANQARTLLLLGESAASREVLARALAGQPYNPLATALQAEIAFRAGETASARRVLRRALAVQPHSFLLLATAGEAEHWAGADAAALQYLEAAFREPTRGSLELEAVRLAAVCQRQGKAARAAEILARVRREAQSHLAGGDESPTPRLQLAAAAAIEGRSGEALDWLSEAVDAGFIDAVVLQRDPLFAGLRGEQRVQTLLARIGVRLDLMRARLAAAGITPR